jgi:ribosomal protein L37E
MVGCVEPGFIECYQCGTCYDIQDINCPECGYPLVEAYSSLKKLAEDRKEVIDYHNKMWELEGYHGMVKTEPDESTKKYPEDL